VNEIDVGTLRKLHWSSNRVGNNGGTKSLFKWLVEVAETKSDVRMVQQTLE
jgi:hypothetical protein